MSEPSLIVLGRRAGRRFRAEGPTSIMTLRLSADEKARMEMAAKANRQNVSQFARDALITAAEDCLEVPPSGVS